MRAFFLAATGFLDAFVFGALAVFLSAPNFFLAIGLFGAFALAFFATTFLAGALRFALAAADSWAFAALVFLAAIVQSSIQEPRGTGRVRYRIRFPDHDV